MTNHPTAVTDSGIRVALLYRGPQQEGRDDFSSFVPVGLFNVLHSLRRAGYDAVLHNLSDAPAADLSRILRGIGARAWLVSAFYGCHREAFLLARTAKKLSPAAPVVLGGPLAVLGDELLRREPAIDFLIRGEGEESAPALLASLFAGGPAPSAVPGLSFRTGAGITEVPARLLADIDRHFFLPSQVLPHCQGVRPENLAILISSRGCPFRCTFCSSSALWQNRVRHHAPDLLIRYLHDLRASTGTLYFSLRDENFLVHREHVRAFATALARSGLHYLWNAQGSAQLLDEEVADLLAEAGCDQVQMGIEAVASRLRTLLGKAAEPEQARRAITLLRNRLIRPFGYFIYGMGESEEEGRASLDFLAGSGLLDAVASPLVLYPGTALARKVPAARFFDQGEVFLHNPASAKKWRPRYERALRTLSETGAFSRRELAKARGPAAEVARHFHLLAEGKTKEAKKRLLLLHREQPENPWWPELLAQMRQG